MILYWNSDFLEEGLTTYSSTLAWRIPWTEEPGGLQSKGWQSRTRLKWLNMHTYTLCRLTMLWQFQADSKGTQLDIYPHVSILPQTPLPRRLLCNVEQSSLCYTVGPCQLSILYIAVCTCPSQIDIYCEMICHNEFSISQHWSLVLHPKVTKLFFHKIFMGIQFHLKVLLRLNILTFNFICS